ncbi:MAG TPA: c-type cytochrome [candidate division Zixibacteria bacterium]|nr:c-type cytochrome [candidate division Zixibacteria bacterium]
MERWLGLANLCLALVLGWVFWDSSGREWTGYQESYYRLAAALTTNEAVKEWAAGQRLEIKQLQPKELGSVERCTSCHLGLDDAAIGSLAQPLGAHPALLKSHPPQRFGCVVCHGGEGRAVTTLDAHGQGTIRARSLLKREYMQAACYGCHGEDSLAPAEIAGVIRGRRLVNRYFCLGCHRIDGEGGDEGPDLSAVGSHRDWLWLYAHLARPQGVVAGSTMPVYAMTREEIRDITIYLMTLRDTRDRLRTAALQVRSASLSGKPPLPARVEERSKVAAGDAVERFRYSGRALFRGAGCSLCHTVGSSGGEVGPALTYIGRKRSPEELEQLLRDPDRVLPGGKMPRLYLNDEQVKALVAYLKTLG